MTNKEIMENVLKKIHYVDADFLRVDDEGNLVYHIEDYEEYILAYETFIFSHKFAKEFWGEKQYKGFVGYANWEYHIQHLVLAKDRLKFLEKFL